MGLSKVTKNGLVPEDYDFDKDFQKKDYEPWLKKLVKEVQSKFSNNARWDFEELMSEAWLALVESSQTFDPKISNSFLGYAKPYIYKRLLEFVGVNMYTFKVRYYNIKDDPEKLERVNRLENTLWTDAKHSPISSSMDDGESLTPLETASSGLSVETEAGQKEEVEIVRNIVNGELPAKQRKALIRRFKFDESYREIGKHLGCSAESARNLVIKGLDKLKHKVQKEGIKE